MQEYIEIIGARIHNLKNINVRIPKNQLTVITGVSGSGKSSLAFDTIYEEGKRRYLQFSGTQLMVDTVDKFDKITGLSPTVAVEQRITRQSNPKSTVGTRSKVGNLLALLFAVHGKRDQDYDDNLPLSMEFFQRNSPKGMCVKCLGSGRYHAINEEAIIDMDMPIKDIFDGFLMKHRFHKSNFNKFCQLNGIDVTASIGSLQENVLLQFKYGCRKSGFLGAVVIFHDMQKHWTSKNARNNAGDKDFVLWGIKASPIICPKCHGTGLGEQAIHTTISNKTITQFEQMYIDELLLFFQNQREALSGKTIIDEMITKLQCMFDVGLHHLTLSRQVRTLSGGEIQRLFLSSFIIADMDSIIFIFDEPTVGLHESEKEKLIAIIQNLVKRGNTVVAVEHDGHFINAADYIIDLGPEAGSFGGEVIFQGSFTEFLKCQQSRTSPYLVGSNIINSNSSTYLYRPIEPAKQLTIENANLHNLRNVSLSIPLGVMVGIAGVSGSGKSSLIHDTLVPKMKTILKNKFVHDTDASDDNNDPDHAEDIISSSEDNEVTITGTEHINRCIVVDQRPIGRSKTSCPATYIGITDRIRTLLSKTPEALEKDYSAGMFSLNSEGGCKTCNGDGYKKYYVGHGNWMDVTCDVCGGSRYIEEALSIQLENKNMKDIMEMSVAEAALFFGNKHSQAYDATIYRMLTTMQSVGMGYITLGQQTPSISGGEAQRIKLAKELCKQKGRGNLYILDEPTTGLSFYDTEKLIELMQQLIDAGNSIIVTEHDPTVLTLCDYIVEMGPGGGHDGGHIIAQGTPLELSNNSNSIIGKYLKQVQL